MRFQSLKWVLLPRNVSMRTWDKLGFDRSPLPPRYPPVCWRSCRISDVLAVEAASDAGKSSSSPPSSSGGPPPSRRRGSFLGCCRRCLASASLRGASLRCASLFLAPGFLSSLLLGTRDLSDLSVTETVGS